MPVKKTPIKKPVAQKAVIKKSPVSKTVAKAPEIKKSITSKVLPKKKPEEHVKIQTAEGWKRAHMKKMTKSAK